MDVLCIRLNLILRKDLRADRKVCLSSSKISKQIPHYRYVNQKRVLIRDRAKREESHSIPCKI